jgi:NDP-4-keto-2,6-dideoxyhexose 3-C-methyltransferase
VPVHCRSCHRTGLTEVLDLGNQCLSDFRDYDRRPPQWPLVLMLCRHCGLAQLRDTTPRELMYHDRYRFRSGVNEAIREDLRSIAEQAVAAHPGVRRWLDIACNDGTLLSFVPEAIHRVGIDPVSTFEQESHRQANRIVVDFFDPKRFATGRVDEPYERFDVVTSRSHHDRNRLSSSGRLSRRLDHLPAPPSDSIDPARFA